MREMPGMDYCTGDPFCCCRACVQDVLREAREQPRRRKRVVNEAEQRREQVALLEAREDANG